MGERIIHIVTEEENKEQLSRLAERYEALTSWVTPSSNKQIHFYMLVDGSNTQELLDVMQHKLQQSDNTHVMIQQLEAYVPTTADSEAEEEDKENAKKKAKASILREELEKDMAAGAAFDRNFVLLVIFSTIVAAIGLIENNVAVLVGAMVIAPFLGPNLALTFSVAMGKHDLALKALRTLGIGSAISFAFGVVIGQFWPFDVVSTELIARTAVDYSTIFLALASGAAAVLSLTKGISSVLVGVMVAVALLPPLTASALFFGHGMVKEGLSALLLLAVNIVCINLSGLLMFIFRGIGPRTWWEKRNAKRSVYLYAGLWLAALIGLAIIITIRNGS